jgi:hypothetical protein
MRAFNSRLIAFNKDWSINPAAISPAPMQPRPGTLVARFNF